MIFLFFSKKVDLFLRTQKFHMIFQHCGKKKNLAKIWLPGGQKSHFFKINKGSRFGLLRFGSVLKSRKRFGRFEVRFTRGSGGSRFGIFRFDPTLFESQTNKKLGEENIVVEFAFRYFSQNLKKKSNPGFRVPESITTTISHYNIGEE